MNTWSCKSGMLWFDDSGLDLARKIRTAAAYYKEKYGRKPLSCTTWPGSLGQAEQRIIDGIVIEESAGILENNFWLTHENGAT